MAGQDHDWLGGAEFDGETVASMSDTSGRMPKYVYAASGAMALHQAMHLRDSIDRSEARVRNSNVTGGADNA